MNRIERVAGCLTYIAVLSITITSLSFVGCSSTSTPLPNSLSSVSMSPLTPSTASLRSGQQVQFAVTVSGTTNTALSWDLVDANGKTYGLGDNTVVGTITQAGLYTAPTVAAATNVTVMVGAASDTSVSRASTITVNPPVAITLTPPSASVQTCSSSPCPLAVVSFTAKVSNAQDASVTWQVNGATGGNASVGEITNAGVYTAPANVPSPSQVTITAVANADSTKTAQAQVTITAAPPPIVVILNQTSATILAGQSFDAQAMDGQGNLLAVSYTVSCPISNCGTVAPGGTGGAVYTAPSSLPGNNSITVSLLATAVADTSKSATASITVNPPVAASLSIVFDTSSPVHAGQTIALTAVVNNLPSASPTPVINWTQNNTLFCISTDEAETVQDNCNADNDDDDDGPDPGTITPVPANPSTALYKAPTFVWTSGNGGLFIHNSCPQATNANQPYVYVTASTVVNGVTLPASACIAVSP